MFGEATVEQQTPSAQPIEQSSRPPEITPVLEEHKTPPPAIVTTPTVTKPEEKILGMPKNVAIGAGIGVFLLLLFR